MSERLRPDQIELLNEIASRFNALPQAKQVDNILGIGGNVSLSPDEKEEIKEIRKTHRGFVRLVYMGIKIAEDVEGVQL